MCLVLISNNRSPDTFHELRKVKDNISNKLASKKLIHCVLESAENYLTMDAGIPQIKHFMYCSNSNNQGLNQIFVFFLNLTSVTVPAGFDGDTLARYRALFSMITSGEVKLLYRSNIQSVNVVWKTKNFILFAAFGPLVRRKIVIQSITKLLTWLRKRFKYNILKLRAILNNIKNLAKKKRTRPFCDKRLLLLKSASTSIIYHHWFSSAQNEHSFKRL